MCWSNLKLMIVTLALNWPAIVIVMSCFNRMKVMVVNLLPKSDSSNDSPSDEDVPFAETARPQMEPNFVAKTYRQKKYGKY